MHKAIAAGAPYAENTAWCRAQLALMLWSTGAVLPAAQLLHTALAATPHNYHVLAALGKIKAAQQDYDAAIDYYKRASASAPQLEVVIALGDLYRLAGQAEAANKQDALVDVIHQLNTANGVRDDIHMARFYADREQHLSTALQSAEAVYKTRPNVFVADTLAWCYYKNGRYEEARKAVKKALSQNTPDAMILFHAGMIYAKLGEHTTAQKYLYQALSLHANFHPLYATVAADTLQQLGTRQPTAEHTEVR
jgi:tetratricopeptide (TPR) repeat protein